MSIRFERITEIAEKDFTRIFNDCIDNLNTGAYPWEETGLPEEATNEDKRVFLFNVYSIYLEDENMITVGVYDNELLVQIFTGYLKENNVFLGLLTLIGRNAAGSKSYLYAEEYQIKREEFWIAQNFTGIEFEISTKGSEYFDHVSKAYELAATNPQWAIDAMNHRGLDKVSGVPEAPGELVFDEDEAEHKAQSNLGNTFYKFNFSEVRNTESEDEPEDDPDRLSWATGEAVANGQPIHTEEFLGDPPDPF